MTDDANSGDWQPEPYREYLALIAGMRILAHGQHGVGKQWEDAKLEAIKILVFEAQKRRDS